MTNQALTDLPGMDRLCALGHRESVVFPDLLGTLPAQITGAGFCVECGPNYNGNGRNPSSEGLAAIRYTLSGRGRFRYRDQELLIEPGQALLLYFPYDHHYWIEAGERWEFFYLTLAGREVISCIRAVADNVSPVLTLAANSPTLERVSEACADALEDKIESPYQGSALAHAILMGLLTEHCPPSQVPTCRLPTVPDFVVEVEEFCRQNYAHPIGVADMARMAKLSRFHFTRVFQKVWGIAPGRFLGLIRLEQAMHLARAGRFTAKELAQQCGFNSANYFYKAFRKHFGVPPGSFKAHGSVLRTPAPLPTMDRPVKGPAVHENQARGGPQ
jgi:AraC-like DNA-binding protein